MFYLRSVIISLIMICTIKVTSQIPSVLSNKLGEKIIKDNISRYYITPHRIVWISDPEEIKVKNSKMLLVQVTEDGKENLENIFRFLDWPSSINEKCVHADLQALMIITFQKGAFLCRTLNNESLGQKLDEKVELMRQYIPDPNNCMQAVALMALAGIIPVERANSEIIAIDGPKNFSTFYGYYMLEAQALAGDYSTSLNNIRQFWVLCCNLAQQLSERTLILTGQ